MTAGQWAIIVILVLVALGIGVMLGRRRRTARLRERFGPEYERLAEHRDGDRGHVGAELDERIKRRERFDLRELAPADRDRYAQAWRQAQLRFVDQPGPAIAEADRLVMEVMRARGYPVEDFEQRAADLSVEHPVVVQHYRAGHEIAERHADGQASTEDLRQAMVHYRELFQELLGVDTVDGAPGTDGIDGADKADEAPHHRAEDADGVGDGGVEDGGVDGTRWDGEDGTVTRQPQATGVRTGRHAGGRSGGEHHDEPHDEHHGAERRTGREHPA